MTSSQMDSTIQDQITGTIFGEHLSPEYQNLVVSKSKIFQINTGEFLFREGEVNHQVYLLLDGQIDLTMAIPGRGAIRILSLGSGEIIAWSSVLGDGTMTSSAVCTRPSRLLAMDCDVLRSLIESNAHFGYEFMKMMASALASRLLATRLQLLDLFEPNSNKLTST